MYVLAVELGGVGLAGVVGALLVVGALVVGSGASDALAGGGGAATTGIGGGGGSVLTTTGALARAWASARAAAEPGSSLVGVAWCVGGAIE